MRLYEKIKLFLNNHSAPYFEIHHEPATTSEDSARARGESMRIGAKALLVKARVQSQEKFVLAVLPADRKLDLQKLGELLGGRISFASPDELQSVTGCTKGAVPPFGELIGIKMIVDSALFDNEDIAFNAASLTNSIKMKSADYRRIVMPREGEFTINQFHFPPFKP